MKPVISDICHAGSVAPRMQTWVGPPLVSRLKYLKCILHQVFITDPNCFTRRWSEKLAFKETRGDVITLKKWIMALIFRQSLQDIDPL